MPCVRIVYWCQFCVYRSPQEETECSGGGDNARRFNGSTRHGKSVHLRDAIHPLVVATLPL